MDERRFGGVIWTNHALVRLRERGLTQNQALVTLKHPDRSRFAVSQNAWIYNKTFGQNSVEVVAAQNELHVWVVVSVWSRPTATLSNRYLVRNRVVDWLLDHLIAIFHRPTTKT